MGVDFADHAVRNNDNGKSRPRARERGLTPVLVLTRRLGTENQLDRHRKRSRTFPGCDLQFSHWTTRPLPRAGIGHTFEDPRSSGLYV